MRKEEALKSKQESPVVKFVRDNNGRQVFVGGMWTGDFIGTILSHGFTEAVFRVEKPLTGDTPRPGEKVTFPLGKYLNLRNLTDSEAQITISEAVGDVEIQ